MGGQTLRAIRQLKPAYDEVEEKSTPTRNWTRAQGIVFATGIVLTFSALAVCGVLAYTRSKLETEKPEVKVLPTDEKIDGAPADAVWNLWQSFESVTPDEWREKPFVEERRKSAMIGNILMILLIVAGSGVAISLSSVFLKPGRQRPARPAPDAKQE